MGTDIRPEISKRKPYWISRHRFYELKHFCLQYGEWKKELNDISYYRSSTPNGQVRVHSKPGDPVTDAVIRRELLTDRIQMLKKAEEGCSEDLGNYIFKGVTEGLSYENLLLQNGLPCCKDTYYETYRKFFWILSKLRK